MYSLKQISCMTGIKTRALQRRSQREHWPVTEVTTINHAPTNLYTPENLPPDLRGKLTVVTPSGNALPVPVCAASIPEKARDLALARLDLVQHWRTWRDSHTDQRRAQADDAFLLLYNSGVSYQRLRRLLGDVSVKTLYRWHAALENTLDWTRLVPLYGNVGAEDKIPNLSLEEKTLFERLILNPKRPSVGSAAKLVRFAFIQRGVEPHSLMTFRRYAQHLRSRQADLWTFAREGHKALADKVAPFIRRDAALLSVGQVLVADGHRLNFNILNPYTGKACRATLIVYLDWKSYYPAGFEIMPEENTQAIASALRNAILNLGKVPEVCYQDNGKAFRSRFFNAQENLEECGFYGAFGRLGIAPVFAQPYNARAKVVEGWFRHFGETFERLVPSYTGASIADKPAWMMRNEKFHRAMHDKYVLSIEEAKEYINLWLNYAGAQENPYVKGKTRREVFESGRGPGVDIARLDELMLAMKVTRLSRNGVRLFGQEYYNEALYGLQTEVLVRYSLMDLGKVRLYDLRGNFICEAARVEKLHPMAARSGEPKDMAALQHAQRRQRRLMADTRDTAARILAPVPEVAWSSAPARTAAETSAAALPAPEEPAAPASASIAAAPVAEGERPLFMKDYQRYDWLLKHSDAQTAEDRTFMASYENKDEFQMFYKSYNS